jgi:hypothetical protein
MRVRKHDYKGYLYIVAAGHSDSGLEVGWLLFVEIVNFVRLCVFVCWLLVLLVRIAMRCVFWGVYLGDAWYDI